MHNSKGKYEVDGTYLHMATWSYLGGICLIASLSLLSCKGLQFQKVDHAQLNSDIGHEKGNNPSYHESQAKQDGILQGPQHL